jgi:hypothetical protein
MNKVIARLTVNRANGQRLIIEVHNDATFNQFYRYFQQQGNRRSTKKLLRTASRNEGLKHINAHLQTPGLEAISNQIIASSAVFLQRSENGHINPVVSIKLQIFAKRAYRKLITARADELGMARLSRTDLNGKPITTVRIPAFLILDRVGVAQS